MYVCIVRTAVLVFCVAALLYRELSNITGGLPFLLLELRASFHCTPTRATQHCRLHFQVRTVREMSTSRLLLLSFLGRALHMLCRILLGGTAVSGCGH